MSDNESDGEKTTQDWSQQTVDYRSDDDRSDYYTSEEGEEEEEEEEEGLDE